MHVSKWEIVYSMASIGQIPCIHTGYVKYSIFLDTTVSFLTVSNIVLTIVVRIGHHVLNRLICSSPACPGPLVLLYSHYRSACVGTDS